MANNIINNMTGIYKLYNSILHSAWLEDSDLCMWDMVVLTTHDERQKNCFQLYLEEIFSNKPLLKKRFYLIADPPNQKLGNGGSTLHVLKTLVADIGPTIYSKKIIIIHSGGSSQRLPSYSSQGKIFSPIPIKDFDAAFRVSHMIDLKLAMYLPFCKILGPGVFVSCADDIETYYFDESLIDLDKIKLSDVVALAHPCDLDTAKGHGVYVLPENFKTLDKSVIVSECLEVLQKPSISLMREKNAIILKDNSSEEMVYSDSVFWMSERVCQSLLTWYNENSPLLSELDAYGHILPCLGSSWKDFKVKLVQEEVKVDEGKNEDDTEEKNDSKSEDHSDNNSEKEYEIKKEAEEEPDRYKAKLFPILKNFNFNLIVLNDSKFYHLGSMEEYLYNFSSSTEFTSELKLVFNIGKEVPSSPTILDSNQENATILYSHFSSPDLVSKESKSCKIIIEWCQIELSINFEGDAILSNCVLKNCNSVKMNHDYINIPSGFLFHTMPINFKSRILYVTAVFEITADMKAIHHDTDTLAISDVSLTDIIRISQLKKGDILPSGKSFSLFDIKLFQAGNSPEESFWRTFQLIDNIINWREDSLEEQCSVPVDNNPYYSMKDIVASKDLKTFFADRKYLLELLNITS